MLFTKPCQKDGAQRFPRAVLDFLPQEGGSERDIKEEFNRRKMEKTRLADVKAIVTGILGPVLSLQLQFKIHSSL